MANYTLNQSGTQLTITIDLSVDGAPPRPAGTKGATDKGRKGWLIASTEGNVSLAQQVNGREMKIGLNVFTADAPQKATKGAKRIVEGE